MTAFFQRANSLQKRDIFNYFIIKTLYYMLSFFYFVFLLTFPTHRVAITDICIDLAVFYARYPS